MKYIIKNKLIFSIILIALGLLSIYDWIILPALNSKNIIINIIAFITEVFLVTILGVILFSSIHEKENDVTSVIKKNN